MTRIVEWPGIALESPTTTGVCGSSRPRIEHFAVGSNERTGSLQGRQLDRISGLRSASDLDLLLFFARHPRSLLPSDQIARFLGYDLEDVAASLEVLIAAGVVTRIRNPTRVAQLFVFMPGGSEGGALPSLLELASTREGRVHLMRALAPDRDEARGPRALADSRRTVVGG